MITVGLEDGEVVTDKDKLEDLKPYLFSGCNKCINKVFVIYDKDIRFYEYNGGCFSSNRSILEINTHPTNPRDVIKLIKLLHFH
jgi:hypothetical protein